MELDADGTAQTDALDLDHAEGERLLESFPEAFFAHQSRRKSMVESVQRLELLATRADLTKLNPKAIRMIVDLEKAIQKALVMQTASDLRAAYVVSKIGFSKRGGGRELRSA